LVIEYYLKFDACRLVFYPVILSNCLFPLRTWRLGEREKEKTKRIV